MSYSPDVTNYISAKHDAMIGAMVAGTGLNSTGVDTLMIGVKAWLDANVSGFKDGSGEYTANHVRQAVTTILNSGK